MCKTLNWRMFVAGLMLLGLGGMTVQVLAADPDSVSFTLEGCRQESLPMGYDIEANNFLCDAMGADGYTTGNLGKEWNELDLVPWRVTTSAGNSAPNTQTYTVAFAVDHEETSTPGYDVITNPTLNASLSDASCILSVDPAGPPGGVLDPGVGGTDKSLYRLLTITQDKNTDCVIDGQARLAVGSHDFPGSSLHFNLLNEDFEQGGVGNKDVSIPVMEIEPQEISKTMDATQDTDFMWNITKGPMPANLNFGNTCAIDNDLQEQVMIQVDWQILPGLPGMVTIITNISATNPAARTITVDVSDTIFGDLGMGKVPLDTKDCAPVDVPANTLQLVCTHMFDAPANVTNLMDTATATYTDKVTGVPVPGETTAMASADIQPGNNTNTTAIITDVESITGLGLSYSVDGTAMGSASGSFGGYTLGTPTTGDVTWTSVTQSGDGFVKFNKTIYLDEPRITTGTLSDTASLNASDGFMTSAMASVGISSSATVTLTIEKTIPDDPFMDVLFDFYGGTMSFDFGIYRNGQHVGDKTITFTKGGDLSKTAEFMGDPGDYTVTESDDVACVGPVMDTGTQMIDLNLPTCSGKLTFNNELSCGFAKVEVRKVTIPAGSEAGWDFNLDGPAGSPYDGAMQTTVDANFIRFPGDPDLLPGQHTITETDQEGWDKTGEMGDCDFNVVYPDDEGRVFQCTMTNTQRAMVMVHKTVTGVPTAGFKFQVRKNASTMNAGTVIAAATTDATGEGVFTCVNEIPGTCEDVGGVAKLVPGDYQFCEVDMLPGWDTSLDDVGFPPAFVPDGDQPIPDNSSVCVPFTLGAGETETFTVNNEPPPGGDARTIGFWKNWTSCDGHGNQDPVLDDTLAAAGGTIFLGSLAINNCEDAVLILDKRDLGGKHKKRASDACYALGAQLLAAKLNVVAGANQCPMLLQLIGDADTLLTNVGFDGTGACLKPKDNGNRTLAHDYAGQLDDYNNNESNICP